MYSSRFMVVLNLTWAACLGAVLLISSMEVGHFKGYLAYANSRSEVYRVDLAKAQQKIDDLETSKFVDKMEDEGAIQKERLKTHEANERHGETLERVRKAAAAKMTPEAFENFIFSYADKEVNSSKVDPMIKMYRSLDQDKWGEVLKKHYSTK